MTTTATEWRPIQQRIIRAIKEWVRCLEAEYREHLAEDEEHLMGHCIDQITTLCGMLDEINIMEQEEAEQREKLDDAEDEDADLREAMTPILKAKLDAVIRKMEQRMPELEKQFGELVGDMVDEDGMPL